MKTTNYRLQTEIEYLSTADQKEWFKNYIRQVLESDKPYHAKADYIGLSIKEIDNKINYLTNDIKEMQSLKKSLQTAKTLAQETIASTLLEYGIDRIDGTVVSSITITPQKTKFKEKLVILDEEALIQLGYYKVVADEEAVKKAMQTLESMDEIDRYTQVEVEKEVIPARIKVNTRRGTTNNQASELLNITEQQQQAA